MGSGGPIGSSKAIQVPKSQRNPLKYSNFQKKSVTFLFLFFFFFLEESCRVPQARVTCYAASAQRRRREAQARSTGAQRRRAAPNVCSAAGAVPHLAPLQAVRSSWHERSEGHERSPVGVSSRWSCVSAGRRERAASEAKQQATVKYIYIYLKEIR